MKLNQYIAGKQGRAARLAARVGVSAPFIAQIADGHRDAPPELGAAIERATRLAVRRWELRPDDWWQIWPELVETEGAPELPPHAKSLFSPGGLRRRGSDETQNPFKRRNAEQAEVIARALGMRRRTSDRPPADEPNDVAAAHPEEAEGGD